MSSYPWVAGINALFALSYFVRIIKQKTMDFKKHIPNAITCCNLISGCIAIYAAMYGLPQTCLAFIIIGAIFDFFDGMSARLLHVSSEIGKELDSLADVVTFGVAPASLLFWFLKVAEYPALLEPLRNFLPFSAFLIAAFSALRLAKFNLDTRQTTSFIGLPTPANALFWGAFIASLDYSLAQYSLIVPIILIGIIGSCWMLVSEIPMFALKFKHWRFKGNEIKYGFAAFSAATMLFGIVYGVCSNNENIVWTPICIIIPAYVIISVITRKK